MLHISLHFIVPLVIAWIIDKKHYFKIWMILILSMLIDLDHLLANPIYDPNRCSIGFHPLHSYVAIIFYTILLVFPKTRIFGAGLLIHIFLDSIDCLVGLSRFAAEPLIFPKIKYFYCNRHR